MPNALSAMPRGGEETQVATEAYQVDGSRVDLESATRLIILQPKGRDELPTHLHPKVRVIYQSVPSPRRYPPRSKTTFDVCVLGHLRPVKDPFRTALAARLLPTTSRLRVLHVGKALSDEMAAHARAEMADNPRYRWLGELPRWRALRVLARSHVLVLSSHTEGGANVLSEALALGVPFDHIFFVENGSVVELNEDEAYIAGRVLAGNVFHSHIGNFGNSG